MSVTYNSMEFGMRRSDVLQGILDMFVRPKYLEIGVSEGTTFHAIGADFKVAVDPVFQFDFDSAKKSSDASEYHQVTSDFFFSKIASRYPHFDVIYLDGLHTFEQTLRDLLNSLRYITDRGVIVVDDVIPSSYHASLPNPAEFSALHHSLGLRDAAVASDGSWMGDVFKLVFFVSAFLPEFSYRTTGDNHGQLVLWPQKRDVEYYFTMKEIVECEFKDVVSKVHVFRKARYQEISNEIQTFLSEFK